VTNADCETSKPVQVDVDGVTREGRFRVVSGDVIVYFENEFKFAQHELHRPEVVARWLLSDLCRRVEARKKKGGSRR
jgi:hypothetical protein